MSDMIPALRLVGMANRRLIEARDKLRDVEAYHSGASDLKAAKAAIDVALELLAATLPEADGIHVGADPAIRMVPVHLPELSHASDVPDVATDEVQF